MSDMITIYNNPERHINFEANENYEDDAIAHTSSQQILQTNQTALQKIDSQQLSPAQNEDINTIWNTPKNKQTEHSVQLDGKEMLLIQQNLQENYELQINQIQQRSMLIELNERIKSDEVIIKNYKESIDRYCVDLSILNLKQNQLENRIKQLLVILQQKDQALKDMQQSLMKSQTEQQQKIMQLNQKYKKLYLDNKEQADKIRKSNTQLEKEKKINKELRGEMTAKIEQLQSNKQFYLTQQIEKLKEIIESSKDQREIKLANDFELVTRKAYLFQRQLRKKDIEITLMERKKQQAVNEIAERKDKEIKIQKTLYRALNQKYNKLQQKIRSGKQKNAEVGKSNRLNKSHEQEIILQLTPEKN